MKDKVEYIFLTSAWKTKTIGINFGLQILLFFSFIPALMLVLQRRQQFTFFFKFMLVWIFGYLSSKRAWHIFCFVNCFSHFQFTIQLIPYLTSTFTYLTSLNFIKYIKNRNELKYQFLEYYLAYIVDSYLTSLNFFPSSTLFLSKRVHNNKVWLFNIIL